jgi:hypothetical protein
MTSTERRIKRWTPLGIFAVVMGFVVWWPLGMAAIGYILWGGSIDQLVDDLVAKASDAWKSSQGKSPSGSPAFDAYRAETLTRLESEQADFAAFVKKLREARDAEEFDRFMNERDRS